MLARQSLDAGHLIKVVIEGKHPPDLHAPREGENRAVRVGPLFVFIALEQCPSVAFALFSKRSPEVSRVPPQLTPKSQGNTRAKARLEKRHGLGKYHIGQYEEPILT